MVERKCSAVINRQRDIHDKYSAPVLAEYFGKYLVFGQIVKILRLKCAIYTINCVTNFFNVISYGSTGVGVLQ